MNKVLLLISLMAGISSLRAAENISDQVKSYEQQAQEYRATAAHCNKMIIVSYVGYVSFLGITTVLKKFPGVTNIRPLMRAINIVEPPFSFAWVGYTSARDTLERDAKKFEKKAAEEKKANAASL
jgi:hypothetical protein